VIIPPSPHIGFNKLELLYVGPINGKWRSINREDLDNLINFPMKLDGNSVELTPALN